MNTNGGKVYHTLLNKINNNLICIIQKYNGVIYKKTTLIDHLRYNIYLIQCCLSEHNKLKNNKIIKFL